MDRGAGSRPCPGQGGGPWLAASLRRPYLGWTGFSEGEIRGTPALGPRGLAPGSYWTRRTFPRFARSSAKGTHLRTRTADLPIAIIATTLCPQNEPSVGK